MKITYNDFQMTKKWLSNDLKWLKMNFKWHSIEKRVLSETWHIVGTKMTWELNDGY